MGRVALGLSFLPFVVAAIVLVVRVRGSYLPMADHALTEMHVRDVGHHPVLTGLYSRDDWSHPGPMLFYLLAPVYWLTRGSSIALNLGALAINAASVAGIAFVARRRGGTTLMLWSLLACSLLIRTLSADFVRDPWNNYVVTLPFALLIFLVWAMVCGERWAVPAGVVVASFLAQTHVGFFVLAVPLFAFGALWSLVAALRSDDASEKWTLARAGGLSLLIAAVLWLPVVVDIVTNRPSNASRIVDYFRNPDAGIQTVGEAWRVVTGQFAAVPEWLTSTRTPSFGGESPYVRQAPFPLALVLLVLAGVGFWKMKQHDGLRLLATLAVTFVLGVVAVDRTIGLVLDYRLRWTWALGMAGFAAGVWCVALLLTWWRPVLGTKIVPVVGLVSLAMCTTVNIVSAATAGVPQHDDGKVLEALMPAVLDGLSRDPDSRSGQVMVDDGDFEEATFYARSLLLQLERHGYDARMAPPRGLVVGEHREGDDGRVGARLVVAMDRDIARRDADPSLRLLAKWSSVTADEERSFDQRAAALDRDVADGRISGGERLIRFREIDPSTTDPAVAWAVAVYEAR